MTELSQSGISAPVQAEGTAVPALEKEGALVAGTGDTEIQIDFGADQPIAQGVVEETLPSPIRERVGAQARSPAVAAEAVAASSPKKLRRPVATVARKASKAAPIPPAVSEPAAVALPKKSKLLPRSEAATKPATKPVIKVTQAAKVTRKSAPKLPAKPISSSDPKADVMDVQTPPAKAAFVAGVASAKKTLDDAFAKSVMSAGHLMNFTKDNARAVAEAGEILGAGLNELASARAAEGYQTLSLLKGDVEELAQIRSPAALLKFQMIKLGRNVGLTWDYGSRNAEAVVALAKNASAPLSGRVAAAASILRKAI